MEKIFPLLCGVSDPERIRMQLGLWIGIQVGKNNPQINKEVKKFVLQRLLTNEKRGGFTVYYSIGLAF
jgi:hypothetical protein